MNLSMTWNSHSQHRNFYKPTKIKNKQNLTKAKKLDEYKCRVCGSYKDISAHHIVNRSLGGDDALSNLITLCFPCHRQIHDGKLDFREYLNRLSRSPKPDWFRWEDARIQLNRRRRK